MGEVSKGGRRPLLALGHPIGASGTPVGKGVPRGNGVPPGRKNPKKPEVSWHTTFAESLVCYTFCPGWRGKGEARSDADAFSHQEIRRWDGAAAIIPSPDFGRDKRYIKPPSLVSRPAAATPATSPQMRLQHLPEVCSPAEPKCDGWYAPQKHGCSSCPNPPAE